MFSFKFTLLPWIAATSWGLLPTSLNALDDPVTAWRTSAKIQPATELYDRHTIHSYYLTNPESPDGTQLLFFTSRSRNGEEGDLVVKDRRSGVERVIARGINTEDAHRGACQQWISGGRRVAYHDVKHGRWSVHVVDLATMENKILAQDRQLCFGRAVDDFLPLYGCHWNPGAYRDLEYLNASTGEIRTIVTLAEVEKAYGGWLRKEFGDRPTSIFFPHISPDGNRVFFKMAAQGPDGASNNYASKQASHRQGTVVYDLSQRKLVFMREKWGHPAWHPDSIHILEASGQIFDTNNGGAPTVIPGIPKLPGDHPSMNPTGTLFVKDGPMTELAGNPGEWCVLLGDVRGNNYTLLHRFSNAGGALSWRRNHPHPIFSTDGKRVYFNTNDGPWTRLYVAEVRTNAPATTTN